MQTMPVLYVYDPSGSRSSVGNALVLSCQVPTSCWPMLEPDSASVAIATSPSSEGEGAPATQPRASAPERTIEEKKRKDSFMKCMLTKPIDVEAEGAMPRPVVRPAGRLLSAP